MKYVVQVRPFPHPHHEADVLIPVFEDDDVDRLVRWFQHNCLDTKVHRLDDNDDVVNLAAADQLVKKRWPTSPFPVKPSYERPSKTESA